MLRGPRPLIALGGGGFVTWQTMQESTRNCDIAAVKGKLNPLPTECREDMEGDFLYSKQSRMSDCRGKGEGATVAIAGKERALAVKK